jgi:competence protein ComEC
MAHDPLAAPALSAPPDRRGARAGQSWEGMNTEPTGSARLRRVAPERWVILGLVLLALGGWAWVWQSWPRSLELIAIPVGAGDALLLRTSARQCVLIDGGSRSGEAVGREVLVPTLYLLGVRRLDAVLITHPDADHCNGLADVLAEVPVGRVVTAAGAAEAPVVQRVLAMARRRHVRCAQVGAGDTLTLAGAVRLHVLSPPAGRPVAPFLNDNNRSVVCRLEYGRTRALLTGDLEAFGEAGLLARGADLRAEVLKVAHHGSGSSCTPGFLRAVHPRWALISCPGDGQHPNRRVLARLGRTGARILRTDAHGLVRLRSDGVRWQVWTAHEPGGGRRGGQESRR